MWADGSFYNKDKIKLTPWSNKGYMTTGILYNGISRRVSYHRLVAYQKYGEMLFNKGIVVRHLDGNPSNNTFGNIAIGTESDNMMDIKKELRVKKALHATSFVARKDWKEIDIDRKNGYSYSMLVKKYGVSKGALSYHFNRNIAT